MRTGLPFPFGGCGKPREREVLLREFGAKTSISVVRLGSLEKKRERGELGGGKGERHKCTWCRWEYHRNL